MILDNENENLKVHEWIKKYTQTGKLSIVTGYFTVGALAYLSKATKDKMAYQLYELTEEKIKIIEGMQ